MTKIGENTMAQRSEVAAIYTAGMIQGLALVAFPAASTVFTSPQHYDLSSAEYGAIFVPQAITAISSSLLGAGLTRALGAKRVYLLGLGADVLAMALLVLSRFVMHEHTLAYGILLVATACMGVGFGLTVPALNTFAAVFFPHKVDTAVLTLNALLGLGTTLAPVFVALFVGLGFWWGLPLLVGALTVALLLFSLRLPLNEGAPTLGARAPNSKAKLPTRFWVFAAFALLYGICETINGNWASLYMTQQPRSEHNPGVPRPDDLLGHCNRWAYCLRRHWAMVPRTPHLPRPALRCGSRLAHHGLPAEGQPVPRHRRLCAGRSGLFGAAAVDH